MCAFAATLVASVAAAPAAAQMYPQGPSQQPPNGQSRGGSAVVVVNVVGEDGGPTAQGAEVTLSSQGESGRSDMSGSNGTVRFAGVSRGSYVISVREVGYKESYGSVEVPTGYGTFNATVVLQPDSSQQPDATGMVLAPKAKQEYDAGVDALRRQHYDEARTHLEAAYKLAPGNVDINDKLGEFYLVTKNFEKAQQYLQNALSLDPDNAGVLTDLGELRIAQSDYSGAEKSLEQAISIAPNDWFAHWMLGVAYLRVNENEKARQQAAAAIKSGKGNANDAEYLLGEALAKLGRTRDAIRALQLFVKQSPKNSYAPAATALIAKLQSGGTPDSAPGLAPSASPADSSKAAAQ